MFTKLSFRPQQQGGGGSGGGTSEANFTNAEKTKLAALPTGAGLSTQFGKKVDKVEGSTLLTAAQATKLSGIAAGATKNASDADLRKRELHTGVQGMETISGLEEALLGKADASILGTAATKAIGDFATAAQGAKADTAIQPVAGSSLMTTAQANKLAALPTAEELIGDLNNKVDKVAGSSLMTAAQASKLDSLEGAHWKGTFTSLSALQAGVLTPVAGDYADVDVAGANLLRYLWDATDSIWVTQVGDVSPITAAQVKTLYESNTDTEVYTTLEKGKLTALPTAAELVSSLGGKVDKVTGSSLMTTDQATKLAGIAVGATANASDAELRDRSLHTGEQPISSITGLAEALANAGGGGGDLTAADKGKLAELPTATELENSFAEKADLIDIPRQTYRGNFPSLAELKAALGDAQSGDTADVIITGGYGDFLRYACMSPGNWVQINTGAPANPNIPYALMHNMRLSGHVTYTSDLSGRASYPHNSVTTYSGNLERSWTASTANSGAVHVSANDNESRKSSLLSCSRPGSGIAKGVSYFEFSVRRSYENPIARIICGPDNSPQSNPIDFDKSGTVTASNFQNRTGGGLNKLESRTKATLPAAAANANQMYLCTDTGDGAVPVISDGTSWLILQTKALT